MERFCVLGAAGFIGKNLCQNLLKQGYSVRAFGRSHTVPSALLGCEWVSGDFLDPTSVASAIKDCDVIFHLVTSTTPFIANADMLADLNSNVVGSLHLLNACRNNGVRRIIYVSSGGTIYGIPKQIPTPETAPTNPITAYGISKLAIEKYLALYEYLYSMQYRVLRVANPFGPHQLASKNQGVIPTFIQRALADKPIDIWGDGTIIRDYVYIDDVVEALLLATTHDGPSREFNIGSGKGYSLNKIVETISAQLNVKIQVDRRPSRSVDVPASTLDISLANNELKWRPQTTFNQGLESTISWIKSSYSQ